MSHTQTLTTEYEGVGSQDYGASGTVAEHAPRKTLYVPVVLAVREQKSVAEYSTMSELPVEIIEYM